MKLFRPLAPLLALLWFTAAAKKPDMSIRFYTEAHEHDTERFATPIHLNFPPRDAYIEKTPVISERNVRGYYPFQASNGTWGCLFKLDDEGTMTLGSTSLDRRGTSLVAFIGNKKGSRYVIDMIIDKPISDGMVTIQQGLTDADLALLHKEFHLITPKR